MTATVGQQITVRRVWRTTLLGTSVGGTATYRLGVPDGAGGLNYWTGSAWSATPTDNALTQNGEGEWLAGYTIPSEFAGLEVHEVAAHSTYGTLAATFTVEAAGSDTPSATF